MIIQLRDKNIDREISRLLCDYLDNRMVKVKYAGAEIIKHTERGCVQGSTCGPILWNLLLDPLLTTVCNSNVHTQAFADDILIVGSADNGHELMEMMNHILDVIYSWGKTNKLEFAPHKTQAIVITTKHKYQVPTFTMGGMQIKPGKSLKVLGVVIDDGLKFGEHIDAVTNKSIIIYKKTSRAARATWGLQKGILQYLYKVIVEPVVLYAANIWAHKTDKIYLKRKLDKLTRMFAIQIAKCHRTVSFTSSILLAGIIPLHYRAKEKRQIYLAKIGLELTSLPDGVIQQQVSAANLPHPSHRECNLCETELVGTNGTDIMNIFTDGSKVDGKVGAAVTLWMNGKEVKAAKVKLAGHCSVFQAELCAIMKALNIIDSKSDPKCYNIYTDSFSALQTIKNVNGYNSQAHEIRNILNKLKLDNKIVTLNWVKAHMGNKGNERADELAKAAALHMKVKPHFDHIPMSWIRHHIRDGTLTAMQRDYQLSVTGATTKIFFPDIRASYKVLAKIGNLNNLMSQLFTGHGGFRKYLFKYKLTDSPCCICDNETDESVEHIIFDCQIYAYMRWTTECSMDRQIEKSTVHLLIESNDHRDTFLRFALSAISVAVRRNGGRVCINDKQV